MHSLRIFKSLAFVLSLSIAGSAVAHPDQAAAEMADAANAFLATLKPEQKAKATFKLDASSAPHRHPSHPLSALVPVGAHWTPLFSLPT